MISNCPHGWAKKPLSWMANPNDPASFVDGPFGSNLQSHEYTDSGVRLIQLQNIGEGTWDDENKKFISEKKARQLARHVARPGELAIAKMAEPVARACIIPPVSDRFVVVADCIKLSPALDRVDPFFLCYAINHRLVRKQAELKSRGTTRLRLNLSSLKAIESLLPPFPEQRRIAAILNTVDAAKQQTDAVIEKLKKIRQGLLQDLLTRGIGQDSKLRPTPEQAPHLYKSSALGKIPKEWDIILLESVCYPQQWPTISTAQLTPDGYPVFGANGRIGFYHAYNHADPAIAITCRGATCGTVHITPHTCYITGNAMVLDKLDTDAFALEFAAEFLRRRGFVDIITGSAQPQITRSSLLSIQIPKPKLSEQTLVLSILRAHKAHIQQEISVLTKLTLLKQGLMEDLLTGRVRVTDLPKDIEEMLDEIAGRN